MVNGDGRYKMADLKYDLNHGRLEVLRPGASAGPPPKPKPRADAPCAGKKMPEASMEEFFQFLQCQLRFESKELTKRDIAIVDKAAEARWGEVENFVRPD